MTFSKRKRIMICIILMISILVVQTNYKIQEAKAFIWFTPAVAGVAGSLLTAAGLSFANNQALLSHVYSFLTRAGTPIVEFLSTYGVGAAVNVTQGLSDKLSEFVNWIRSDHISNPSQSVDYSFSDYLSHTILNGQRVFISSTSRIGITFSDGLSHGRIVYYLDSNGLVFASDYGGIVSNNMVLDVIFDSGVRIQTVQGSVYNSNFSPYISGVQLSFDLPPDVTATITGAVSLVYGGSAVLGQDVTLHPRAGEYELENVEVATVPLDLVIGKTADDFVNTTTSNPPANTGINWEPLKLSFSGFTTAFPFSLPWDVLRAFQGLGASTTIAPTFDIDINTAIFKWRQTLDFSLFNPIMPTIRGLLLIGFSLSLVLITRKLLGGAT